MLFPVVVRIKGFNIIFQLVTAILRFPDKYLLRRHFDFPLVLLVKRKHSGFLCFQTRQYDSKKTLEAQKESVRK